MDADLLNLVQTVVLSVISFLVAKKNKKDL